MYNSGSLFGKWFDLSDYADAADFYKDCYEYHRNEFLPELMLQDWENIPSFLISESSLHQDTLKYLEAPSDMDDQRSEAFEIYGSNFISWPGNENDLEETLKDPNTEFTYQYVEDTGILSQAPASLKRYYLP